MTSERTREPVPEESTMNTMHYATRREIRDFDRHCIEEAGIPGLVLMENAGRQAAEMAVRMLEEAEFRHVVLLAGGGNNGGDGFVVARHLAIHGYTTEIILLGRSDQVKGDARTNLDILEALHFYVHEVDGPPDDILRELQPTLLGADLIIDGLLGTGTEGEIREPFASVINAVSGMKKTVLAIDIPSGLDCDTGKPLGPTLRATRTVTMAAMKIGFKNPDAAAYTGQVTVADIGVAYVKPGE
jgi:NAD(P)H-hydrate epimerase